MPEVVRPKNEVGWATFPIATWRDHLELIDEIVFDYVDSTKKDYVPLPTGAAHPDSVNFPNHRLIKEEAEAYNINKRYWCNGFRNQDQYNYEINYSSESTSHPIFTRRYKIRRDQFQASSKALKFTGIYLIRVDSPGSGYDPKVPPAISITGGGGAGATAEAVISSEGELVWIYLTNEGDSYTSTPTVNIGGGGGATATALLQADTGVLYSIAVTAGGTGYTTNTVVGISGGSGSGASAHAQVADGAIVSVLVDEYGFGFTSAPTISFTVGTGATAVATIQTTALRLVKEDVSEFPDDDPRRSLFLLITRQFESLPGPQLIEHNYDPYLDTFATTIKSVVHNSTVPGNMNYVTQPAGQITEYFPLSTVRSIKAVSMIDSSILWENDGEDQIVFGTVNYSFPNEIPEDPIYRGISAFKNLSLAIDLQLTYDVIEGYSGPCFARFITRFTADPTDATFRQELFDLITYIAPQAHVIYGEFGYAGGNLIAQEFAFQLPSALHPTLQPQIPGFDNPPDSENFTTVIPATTPTTIPRDTWITVSIKPTLSPKFRVYRFDIVQILHPESTTIPA
jgi:hypothetical protein